MLKVNFKNNFFSENVLEHWLGLLKEHKSEIFYSFFFIRCYSPVQAKNRTYIPRGGCTGAYISDGKVRMNTQKSPKAQNVTLERSFSSA